MRYGIITALFLLCFVTACWTDDPSRNNTFIPLTSIEVSAAYDTMADKTVNQYTAIGNYSGSFTRDITAEVDWRVDNRKIATVSNDIGTEGLVTAISTGEATVNARSGDISGNAPVVVASAFLTGIEINPEDAELQIEVTQQYTATGIFSDNSSQDITPLATWVSSDVTVATIDSAGLATSHAVGSTTISGAWDGIENSTNLIVTEATLTAIEITPEQVAIAQGTTEQFIAEGTYSDDTTLDLTDVVEWQSSDNGIAVVNDEGLATGVAPGEAEISASFEVGEETLSGTAEMTVTNAFVEEIRITPEDSIIAEGENQQFTATGLFSDDSEQNITSLATWVISDNSVGTISNSPNSRGLFVSIATGYIIVEATYGGINDATVLTVE